MDAAEKESTRCIRITELSNSITAKIDEEDHIGIVRLLRQCDAELFFGYQGYEAVTDVGILQKICKVAASISRLLKENRALGRNNMVVFSGCGTSGRMGWLVASSFNKLLVHHSMKPCFKYIISGGDESLVLSNELPEDDPTQGQVDLQMATEGADSVLFIGITCGLSAPYVAGQVAYAMQQPNFATVLMGFNPVSKARDQKIDKWDRTCKDVFSALEKRESSSDSAVALCPVVGPEAITGSTRMKGGSMTLVLLDTVSLLGLAMALEAPVEEFLRPCAWWKGLHATSKACEVGNERSTGVLPPASEASTAVLLDKKEGGEGVGSQPGIVSEADAMQVLLVFQSVMTLTYSGASGEGIAELLKMAGDSLQQLDGHLYVIGSQSFGVIGIIDSSEMVDTYGARLDEVRTFIKDGWSACSMNTGDPSETGKLLHISLEDFQSEVHPTLSPRDAVLVVQGPEDPIPEDVLHSLLLSPATCALLRLVPTPVPGTTKAKEREEEESGRWRTVVDVELPWYSVGGNVLLFADFALKLILNAITTGANIIKGRVYGNTMINLTVANSKLYDRAVDIIAKVTQTKRSFAEECLKLSILRSSPLEEWDLPREVLIERATEMQMVIPMAIMLSSWQPEEGLREQSWHASLKANVPSAKLCLQKAKARIQELVDGCVCLTSLKSLCR